MFRHALAAGLVLALTLAPSASASRFEPSTHINYRTFQNPVEQQTPMGATQPDRTLWVVNDTDCAWDVDDSISVTMSGRLDRSESMSYTDCVILDNATHVVGLIVDDGLTGSVVINGALPGYFLGWTADTDCLLTPQYGDPEYLSLPDVSNGHGVRATITWTVTNTSRKPVKAAARAALDWASGQARTFWGCP